MRIDTWLGSFCFELGVVALNIMWACCPRENMSSFFGQNSSMFAVSTRHESCLRFVLWLIRFATELNRTMVRRRSHASAHVWRS